MGSIGKAGSLDDLGNHVYLEKQDKLRDIGVDIPTSQIVVVGGQSSGKSSCLEGLTGFSFPRGQGLCTRYATQITLRRSDFENNVISITPSSNASPDTKQKLREFHRELKDFEPKSLANVIEEANTAMKIRSGDSKDDMSSPMFSDHILKVEISGPDKPHLTVIDVAGLFHVTGEEGSTTESDKLLVDNMVQEYMKNERTIVLVVMSCLADRATERIMQFARDADPKGERTVGVLTKADLVTEKAVHKNLLDLVAGKTLKLGYFVVRNRGADEDDMDLSECKRKGDGLFRQPDWAGIKKLDRCGVEALKMELQVLLTDLAKRELPKQRAEVTNKLVEVRKLDVMGAARPDAASQREVLIKLASKFERIAHDALEGRYDGDAIFTEKPDLKLVTKIVGFNEGFSDLMWKTGHTRKFVDEPAVNKEKSDDVKLQENGPKHQYYAEIMGKIQVVVSMFPELDQIVPADKYTCAEPEGTSIMKYIEECYRDSRGPELGTFGGSMLAMTFRDQAAKWHDIARYHVCIIIVVVHHFIKKLLNVVFLQDAYKRALDVNKHLINIELNVRPSTTNHYFSDNLSKARLERFTKDAKKHMTSLDGTVKLSQLTRLVNDKGNVEQTKEDIHDILKSYYKVARKRFVDNINRQVVEYELLEGPNSPVKALSSELVAKMTDSQLDRIAGEDASTQRERARLKAEIEGLEEAMEVLRS
ncbi:P-loop containing nucleoside triphosphate hydrolase protein [Apodospora peruviana]|uniref:P-loop containing nucleoside triphosphate hydrolase protein n=1 Tax=Apodospora peruviana TaxID=516989 RepID=A0AAE0I655_9PEZI|nr:P-loop containing nucleoside triphosphate hydrolase protein [Apodospora peruviana]